MLDGDARHRARDADQQCIFGCVILSIAAVAIRRVHARHGVGIREGQVFAALQFDLNRGAIHIKGLHPHNTVTVNIVNAERHILNRV